MTIILTHLPRLICPVFSVMVVGMVCNVVLALLRAMT